VSAPLLGIFWFVRHPPARAQLLARTCPLAAAEDYGDCLSSPTGHYETWEAWRRGEPDAPPPVPASIIAADEYEHWPRGRIVLDRGAGTFIVYADRQLLLARRLAQIRTHFHLPMAKIVARCDPQYRGTGWVGRA
jgi:hypothetical protein